MILPLEALHPVFEIAILGLAVHGSSIIKAAISIIGITVIRKGRTDSELMIIDNNVYAPQPIVKFPGLLLGWVIKNFHISSFLFVYILRRQSIARQ